MSEKTDVKIMKCKYNCGAEYPGDPTGQAALMRHYKYDCPNSPEVQKRKEQKAERETASEPVLEAKRQEYVASESMLDQSEVLERIIREVSSSKKTPGVIRMVERYMDDPKKSFEVLAEALRLGDFRPSDRALILKNWAAHLNLGNVEKLIESEGRDEDQKKEDKEKKDEAETGDAIDKEMKKMMEGEIRQLQLLRMRKDRRMLEKELEEPKTEPKKEEEEKQTLIIEGATLKVTPSEMLAWKRYLSDEKEKEEERLRRREEQKLKDEERKNRHEDDFIEWPIGDKVIKVRPETIPLLVMQQTSKKDEDPMLKMVMEELKQTREQFQQFQVQTLTKEVDELKAYAGQDPLDRIFSTKEKLEKLGLVNSGKLTAQERMYDMDRKKLDTMMQIVLDKSTSTQGKVDSLINTVGPVAQEYIKEMIQQMKANRGVAGTEVPRTEQQAQDTLSKLNEVDKAFDAKGSAPVTVGEKGAV